VCNHIVAPPLYHQSAALIIAFCMSDVSAVSGCILLLEVTNYWPVHRIHFQKL